MTVPRSRPAAQPRRVVRRVARPSRRASSMSAGAGSPATARAVSGASPTTPTDGAGRTRPSVSGCASSTALASVPSGHAWPRLTRTASAAPAKPAPRPSDASSRPMSLSTAPSWPLSEHAERRPTSRRSPTVPDEGFYRAGRTRPGPRVHGAPYGPPSGGRSGDGSSRRPRWDIDAGITERDVAALCWLGQQYAARSDVLRVLLGRLSPGSPKVTGQLSEQTLRQILGRWEDRGLIARDRLLGYQWVAPTAKAVRLVGLDVRAWSFVIPQLAPRPRRRGGAPRPGAKHPRGGPLAQRARAAPRSRQEPRPRRRHRAARGPRHYGRLRAVRRGRGSAPKAGCGRGRADPQGRRPAARGLDPAQAWPLAADRLLRPARGRRLPDRPAPTHPPSPCHPGSSTAGGARHQLSALHPPWRCLVNRPTHPRTPGGEAAGRQRPPAGHAAAGLVLPAVHRDLAAGTSSDLAPAPLALVALHPRRPRRDRRGTRRDRPGGGPAPAHLRAPALLAVRRPPLRLR